MKKIILCSFFLIHFCFKITAQNYYMPVPEGFGRSATGGGTPTTSNTVTVTNYSQLSTALNSTASSNSVILVSGTIDCIYTSVTLNNKTIIGLPGAKLRNTQITVGDPSTSAANSGILNIKPGSNNIIIRNLIFEGPGAYDVDGRDNLTNEGTNVWVDHCEFQDGLDGNFDNKGKADNVTVSWCKFTYLKPPTPRNTSGFTDDHRFSDLIGSSKTDFPADNNYSITFKNCYWAEGCKERMPRARNAELHILNCYYNTSVSGALAIGLGGGSNNTTCYVENTNFATIGTVYKDYISTDGGSVDVRFDGCLGKANSGTTTKPSYSYTTLSVTDVATYVPNVSCGAGATLQVSSTGVISTSCPNLGIGDQIVSSDSKLYPTVVDKILNIALPDVPTGENIEVDIFSMSGTKVFSFSKKKVSSNEVLSLNLSGLPKGVYLCKLKKGMSITSEKIIKK